MIKKYYIKENISGEYWMRQESGGSEFGEYGHGHTKDIKKAGQFSEKYALAMKTQEGSRLDVELIYKIEEDPQFNPLPLTDRRIRI